MTSKAKPHKLPLPETERAKIKFEMRLDRWGISKQEYVDTATTELFLTVSEHVCKSISSMYPDSKITIFRRGDKWGYALAVWDGGGMGFQWSPCVQCKIYDSEQAAFEASIVKFLASTKVKRLTTWAKSLSQPQPSK